MPSAVNASHVPRDARRVALRWATTLSNGPLEGGAKPDVHVVVRLAVTRRQIELEISEADEHVGTPTQPCAQSEDHILDVIGLAERDDVRRIEEAERHRRGAVRAEVVLRLATQTDSEHVLI